MSTDDHRKFLIAAQLRARYGGVSHMWIERRLKTDPLFPHPHKFGRLRFWDLDKIDAYERACAGAARVQSGWCEALSAVTTTRDP